MILTLPSNQTDTRTLLYGSLELRYFENEHIFITVQKFIKKSKAVSSKDMQFANRLILIGEFHNYSLYADMNLREHI